MATPSPAAAAAAVVAAAQHNHLVALAETITEDEAVLQALVDHHEGAFADQINSLLDDPTAPGFVGMTEPDFEH
jgi:hypothetical protein